MKSNITPDPALEGQIAPSAASAASTPASSASSNPRLLRSPWTLQEARIIYEIAQHEGCTATDLTRTLGLDPGFLSRTLQALQRRQIVTRRPSKADRRASELALTSKGRAAFAELDNRSRSEVAALLGALDDNQREAVVRAMTTIVQTLEPPAREPAGFLLRSHRPGDIGWVTSRHGAIYAQEYGWDISFEVLVAEIAAQFIKSYDPAREHCWTEIDGEAGRLDLSGQRIKRRRQAATAAGRQKGTRTWRRTRAGRAMYPLRARRPLPIDHTMTQSILVAARNIYQNAGFRLTAEEKHRSFGRRSHRRDLGDGAVTLATLSFRGWSAARTRNPDVVLRSITSRFPDAQLRI